MQVIVNDRPAEIEVDEDTTLGDILDGLRKSEHIPDDEAVVELSVDGRPWQEQGAELDEPVGAVREVTVATDDLRGYARRMLKDSMSMLEVLCEGAVQVAREFRQEMPQKANSDLFNLLDSMQRFLLCVFQIRNTCLPEEEDGALSERAVSGLNDCFDRVEACQQRQDWQAIAETLEGELVPALRALGDDVEAMQQRLAA